MKQVISFTEMSHNEPITQFSDDYKKRHPENMELLSRPDFLIITGMCYEVTWEAPHDCGCEYCEETETQNKYFDKKEDAELFADDLESDRDLDEIEISDGIYFIKAVRQDYHKDGELF